MLTFHGIENSLQISFCVQWTRTIVYQTADYMAKVDIMAASIQSLTIWLNLNTALFEDFNDDLILCELLVLLYWYYFYANILISPITN